MVRLYSDSGKLRLRPEDYTVGWVSALSIELAAAIEMLDEEHQNLPQHPDDTNIYTVGRMGEHNVVIACLPEGRTGNNSAAAVAMSMKAKFPALRFGLMVGIGGGVPSKTNDIRLGDVVISKPSLQHSGVVQYDFGKSTPNGFERTGYLNTPPGLLLSAISKLEAQHHRGQSAMMSYLDKFSRIPGSKFTREHVGPDHLFRAVYEHAGGADCLECSMSALEQRAPRQEEGRIKVHYGTIASGNQVMRNGAMRDAISSELGGVLCFEMEAAGLMNTFPCLVIRGICDYADSHKNKTWQPYAAATAAACARELLSVIPAVEVRAERTAQVAIASGDDLHSHDEACWIVPFDKNPRFVGHESRLDVLEKRIFNDEDSRFVAITGLGGAGKTQLALALVYRIEAMHKNCKIFWVSATSMENFERGYLRIGLHLRLPEIGDENVDVKYLIKEYLSQEESGQWLLVLDGADDIETVFGGDGRASRLVDYLPRSGKGSVVLTTRDRRVASRLTRHIEEVTEMDDMTATDLLRKSLIHPESTDDEAATTKLLRELAHLPLAIVQAAAYMNENGQTVREYLSLLKRTGGNIIKILGSGFYDERTSQDHAIATTWLLSFRKMQQRQPLAARYLSFMACLDPWDIPQSLLPESPSRQAAADAINTLSAYSFISKRPTDTTLHYKSRERGEPRFALQKLVHLATRNWLREEGSLGQWTELAAVKLAQVFQTLDVTNRQEVALYLPHALFILNSDTPHAAAVKDTDLRYKVGVCLLQEGNYKEAERMLFEATRRRKKSLGEKNPVTMMTMAELASAYRAQGRWKEAEDLGGQVVSLQTRVLGKYNTSTLGSMSGLAWTYRKQGRWFNAEQLGKQVLKMQTEVCGRDNPATLATMAHLARTYREQGKWKDALQLAEEVCETRKRLFRAEHPDVLDGQALLASVYRRLGRFEEAEDLGIRVIKSQKKVLGEEHPYTLDSIANLSRTYREQGRFQESEDLAKQVLSARQRILGEEHPRTLAIISQLAWIYRKQNRLPEAEALWTRVRDTDMRVLGEEHPLTLTSMYGLSRTYTEQGRWREASALARHVLNVQWDSLGAEHPWTLANLANMAVIARGQGLLEQAEKYGNYVFDVEKRVFGEFHPWTLDNMVELARTYKAMGELLKAEELAVKVLEGRKKVLGGGHPAVRESAKLLENIYEEEGSWR
ncbi:violaceus kinesin [Podospora didyma]|uniref:Violaceus kinesin n=1 Tax=Podospora didyma TaxID=330526 RepID=A0AAE0U181_9PEZI|nr:violaceus kinesin [Podospora didyma]